MRLIHQEFENPLFLPEQHLGFLIVEDPKKYYAISREFLSQVDDDEGRFILSEKYKALAIPKVMSVVDSPLQLDHNPRRALTALYKQLEKHCVEEALMIELQDLIDELGLRLRRLLPELEVELEEIETPEWNAIFKFYNLRFRSHYAQLEEALLDYLRVTRSYLKIKFFVVIGALQFMDKIALELLNKHAQYEDLRVLFLEGTLPEDKLPKETRTLILDTDLCEIIKYN
jgi:CRISPR type II-A-associated protein Csn2